MLSMHVSHKLRMCAFGKQLIRWTIVTSLRSELSDSLVFLSSSIIRKMYLWKRELVKRMIKVLLCLIALKYFLLQRMM